MELLCCFGLCRRSQSRVTERSRAPKPRMQSFTAGYLEEEEEEEEQYGARQDDDYYRRPRDDDEVRSAVTWGSGRDG